MKLRKQLANFGVIKDLVIDNARLFQELKEAGLFEAGWTAASANYDEAENLFIKANAACKQNFNGNDDASYAEINLSKPVFESSTLSEDDINREKFIIYRMKRLDKSRSEYSEHADESAHHVDTKYLKGELLKIFTFFKGKPCRVRIARLASGKKINAHVDYDPSYIFRYHIPLLTDRACLFYMERNGETFYHHMADDGRVYWLNTGIKHGVNNDSSIDRYHLMIDVLGAGEVENINNIDFFDGEKAAA